MRHSDRKVGAPPARPNIVVSPRFVASSCIPSSVTGKPAALIRVTTSAGAPLVLIAKYSPGSITQAAIIAMSATIISTTIAPYPMSRMRASRASIFGVVPEAIREWNPETAPHAIVMQTNGNTGPAKTGPDPSIKREIDGISMVGRSTTTAMAIAATVPSFKKVLR